MSVPEHAIKSLAELTEVLKDKPSNIYLSPLCLFDRVVHAGGTSLRTTKNTELRGNEIIGLAGVAANIIFTDKPLRANASGAFIFTNYWHAYAHFLRLKQKGTE